MQDGVRNRSIPHPVFSIVSSILQRFPGIRLFPRGQIQGDGIASLGKEKGAGERGPPFGKIASLPPCKPTPPVVN